MNTKFFAIACVMLIIGALVSYGINISRPPAYHTITATFLSAIVETVELFTTATHTLPTTHTVERTTTAVSTVTTTRTVTRTVTTTSVVPFTTTRTVTHTHTVTRATTVTVAAGVDLLVDEDYFHALLGILGRANRSIYIVMYVMKYDPNEHDDPVNVLLYRVVGAFKRGVDVRVLVDDVTYDSYRETVYYLKNSGVPVRLDESRSVTTHAKLVIVDGLYVFVGSHNWTESAFSYNREVTAFIRSDIVAQQAEKYFFMLWSEGRAI